MQSISHTSRRDFIKIVAMAGGGLMLAFRWTDSLASPIDAATDASFSGAAGELNFNSYLSISTDNVITIFSPNPEVGQNIKTSFPMIVAEELDADWANVKVEQANLDAKKFERQSTGGSGAMPHSWSRLRIAGATARLMLIEAAAKHWNVSSTVLTTDNGFVYHKESNRKLSYGELATEAAAVSVPTDVKLKEKKDFKLIGKPIRNVDNGAIVTGKPLFGLDFYREGMLIGMIQRPPSFGTKIKSVDSSAAKAMPGIVDVVTFKNNVAVVGKSTWQVIKARKLLKIEYEPEGAIESTADHHRLQKEMLDKEGINPLRKNGDVDAAFKTAAKLITREYSAPFLSHACMEPMNFFADVRPDGVELAGPTQTPEESRTNISKLLGIPPEKITLQLTRIGGGFGRRLRSDYSMEAAELSSLIKAPVKVMWTREDDMMGGQYRPCVRYRFQAALDANGNMVGYKLRGVGINAGNSTRPDNFPSGSIDNLLIDSVDHISPITTGPWRAPTENFLGFAEQTFLDEVAAEAKQDPIQYRLAQLEKAKTAPVGEIKYDIDRMKGVVELVAEKSSWGKNKNVYHGFSAYFSHRSYTAQVAEIEMQNGQPYLKKIYAAVDCGVVVNISGANQQVKGGIVDGLGNALFGEITIKNGAAEQKNFNAYRLIRMKEVPDVEVHFVDSSVDPTGLGEPALPPAAAAVANAFYKATGKRLYNQPFSKQEEMKGVSFTGKSLK